MNYLRNHFQRRAVIFLVAIMLLTILNMSVYSSIGSFQITSTALAANNRQESFLNSEKKPLNLPGVVAFSAIGAVLVVALFVADEVTEDIAIMELSGLVEPALAYKNKNYAKHDFSKFDN